MAATHLARALIDAPNRRAAAAMMKAMPWVRDPLDWADSLDWAEGSAPRSSGWEW